MVVKLLISLKKTYSNFKYLNRLKMTRPEYLDARSLFVSDWMRANLPDSSKGLTITDLDFILYNYKTNQLMLLEVKQCNGKPSWSQTEVFKILHKACGKGLPKDDYEYLGFHLLKSEEETFRGQIWFDGQLITEDQLIKVLSFDKDMLQEFKVKKVNN